MKFAPVGLHSALAEIPADAWSLPSTYAATRVHHGYRRVVLVSAGQLQGHADPFRFVFDKLAPVYDAWVSSLEPGGFIVPHRDAGPWRERWQIPIQAAGEWCGTESFTPCDGQAFPVEHWGRHAVINRTTRSRIHLVLDRDVWVDRPATLFEAFPVPDDMTDLVRRSLQ